MSTNSVSVELPVEEGTSAVPDAENHEGVDCDDLPKNNPHKHDSGAADLERVTDFAEEKEILPGSASAAHFLDEHQESREMLKIEMAKVVVRKEDVELIANEMEVSKMVAERKLRENRGNVKDALLAMLAV